MAQQAAHANEGAESYAQWRSEKAKGARGAKRAQQLTQDQPVNQLQAKML